MWTTAGAISHPTLGGLPGKAIAMSRIILALAAAIGGGLLTIAVLAMAGIHGVFVTSICIVVPIVIFRLLAKPSVS